MLTINYKHKYLYINIKAIKKAFKRLILKLIVISVLFAPFGFITTNIVKYPEKYFTTWKYQLKNELKTGNQEAIDYYNRVYVSNGIKLFEK